MLIPDKLSSIIRILLINHFENKPNLQVITLAKKVGITSAMAKRLVLRLERSEYITLGRGIKINNAIKLMQAWSYCFSIRELERLEFVAAERPQYVMLKIVNQARLLKLRYAFTLFSATEHINPFVAPSDTYLYISKKDVKAWQSLFKHENMLPTEKHGNIVCLPVDDEYFEGVWEARGVMVASIPQLYADLFSYGGRGEEAAIELVTRYFQNV